MTTRSRSLMMLALRQFDRRPGRTRNAGSTCVPGDSIAALVASQLGVLQRVLTRARRAVRCERSFRRFLEQRFPPMQLRYRGKIHLGANAIHIPARECRKRAGLTLLTFAHLREVGG